MNKTTILTTTNNSTTITPMTTLRFGFCVFYFNVRVSDNNVTTIIQCQKHIQFNRALK